MQNNNSFIKIAMIVIICIGLHSIINIFISKYSIFNYLNTKNELDTLSKKIKEKTKEKDKLLKQVNYLNDPTSINLDIIENEVIKKLNKIPKGYKIIIE